MNTVDTTIVKRQTVASCHHCGCDFDTHEFMLSGQWLTPGCCNDCDAKREQAKNASMSRERQLMEDWRRLCPAEYALTDETQLPRHQWGACRQWFANRQTSGLGLLLAGPARKSKTRCMWATLKLLHMTGVKWECWLWSELLRKLAGHFAVSSADADNFVTHMSCIPLLALDDLGHDVSNARAMDTLKALLEARTRCRLPTIITTNLNGVELKARYGEMAEPIVGRIREFFHQVTFS